MYHQPKKSEEDKAPYTIYSPCGLDPQLPIGPIRMISIDPGRNNFAIRIDQRRTDRTGPIVREVFEKIALPKSRAECFLALYDYLDSIREYLLVSNFLIIERQMQINNQMARLAQHVISYFYLLWKKSEHRPLIIEIDSKLKGKMFGFRPTYDGDIKVWSVTKATEILTERGDLVSVSKIEQSKKKDDLADTVVQGEAILKLIYEPRT